MRRLLIILLLTLLPLQASWAAVCVYCADQCISESATQEPNDETAASADDDGCSRCHLGGAGIAISPAPSQTSLAPHRLSLFEGTAFLDSFHSDRPERPNWTRAA